MAKKRSPKKGANKSIGSVGNAKPSTRKKATDLKDFISVPKSWEENKLLSILGKTGFFLLGFVGGRFLEKQFFKSSDKEGIKKYIAPILTAGGGVYAASRDNNIIKFIGYGLTTAGIVTAANNLLGKDITNLDLKGIGLGDLLSGKKELPVYKDPIVLKLPPYTPSLPDLNSNAEISSIDNSYEPEINGIEDEFDNPLSGSEDDTTFI